MASEDSKSWQARISEATDKLGQSFVESISYDWRLYKHDIAGSIAHATMLAKVKLITDADRDAIVNGLKEIEKEIDRDGAKWAGFKPELEDIHLCVELELTNRIGEPGRRLHTGRSRNDQVATDLLMWIDSANVELHSHLLTLCRALVDLADRGRLVVMPSFTHLQRAQPILAGAEALAWANMFETDRHFCEGMDARDVLPLGSGAIAGSSLGLDAEVTRQLLNFESQPLNSIENTASRDAACYFVFACSMIAQHLSRWAEQWIIYMTTEFGFIKIADRYTTSSSMMPQKRNPDMLELIRGRCGNVYGDLFALMTILKGLPIGYNRDLQEDKRIVFRAYDMVSSCLTMAAAIVASASYDKARIEPTLDRGFLDATSLAEYLVTKGIPFRTAHHIVGTLVARCEKEGKHALKQLSVAEFNEVIDASLKTHGLQSVGFVLTDDVYSCLGAANVVKRYQSAGAAGGKPFEEQLAAWKKRLGMEQVPAAPKAILFDLDDTLLDRARTFEKYFARFAARYRDQLQDCDADELRRNILEADGVGYRPRAEMAGMLLESLPWRKEPSVEQLVAAYREDFLRCAHLSDGAFELLDYLRSRGIKTGVITNGESEVQRRKIEQLGLTQWMDVIVVSAEFGTKKPDAAIFRIALRQLGVDASEAWFVGDHPDFDVTAAEAIGMTAFWIARMTQWPANKPRCARQIESLLDLLRMLTDQPG